jgi:hypothetical protein
MDGSSSRILSSRFNAHASYAEILDYLAVQQTELARADIALVFGNSRATAALAARAADFYHQGYFPRIIASGGNINSQGLIEAHCIRDHLRRYGVPNSAILCDIFAENTQQNIQNARKVLVENPSAKPVKSVFCFGHVKAGRRFLMTMAANWPDVIPILAAAWEGLFPFEDYVQQEDVKRGIYAQYARIPKYTDEGFIEEVDLDVLNQRIRRLRNNHEPA